MINELLNKKRQAIVGNWIEVILNSYPAEASNFLKLKKNQFSNPIGYTITTNAEKIFDELINDCDIEKIKFLLEEIIRIRAVQCFSPSQAVYFLLDLKKAIRDELKTELVEKTTSDELLKIEFLIDQIVLIGFDLYMESREKVFNIRVNEIKSKSYKTDETSEDF
ncbi:MAG: RsbRD N-terminal domain-containing protein [Ignavibacteriaceae bacterium]